MGINAEYMGENCFEKKCLTRMSKCPVCEKTCYAAEEIKVSGTSYHKGCFRCSECSLQLSLRNYNQASKGSKELWCDAHLPKASYTSAVGTFRSAHAMKMQAQNMEGKTAKVLKDGEAPPADDE